MGLPTGYSLVSSLALAALTVAGMQVFREQIAMEGNLWRLAIGGFAGSWLFMFLLTAVGNAYTISFPQNSQIRLFPEVVVCLIVAVIMSGMVHRICATTCIIFSLIALYYLNKISQSLYSPTPSQYSTQYRSTGGKQQQVSPRSNSKQGNQPGSPTQPRKRKK